MTRETDGYYADAGENAAPMFLVSPDAQKRPHETYFYADL